MSPTAAAAPANSTGLGPNAAPVTEAQVTPGTTDTARVTAGLRQTGRIAKRASVMEIDENVDEEDELAASGDERPPKSVNTASTASRTASSADTTYWAAAEAARAKGKNRTYGDDGSLVRSNMGLNALEATNRHGAAARNVNTSNGNFAMLEGEVTSMKKDLAAIHADLLERIGGVSQSIGAFDGQVREAFGAIGSKPQTASKQKIQMLAGEDSDSEVELLERLPPAKGGRKVAGQKRIAEQQPNDASDELMEQLYATIASLERKAGIQPPKQFKPTSFVVNTRQVEEPAVALESPLQKLHALAAARVPPAGYVPKTAAPIEALDVAPRQAEIAMLEARLYDLTGGGASGPGGRAFHPEVFMPAMQPAPATTPPGVGGRAFHPEAFMPTMQSAAATAPPVPRVQLGSKRQREEDIPAAGSSMLGNGLMRYDDVIHKKPRLDYGSQHLHAQDDVPTVYVRIGPWNFGPRIKDIKATLNEMFNSLPQSHLIRAPQNINKCANKQFVVVQAKTVGEAQMLMKAWEKRGTTLVTCEALPCPADEVASAFTGGSF